MLFSRFSACPRRFRNFGFFTIHSMTYDISESFHGTPQIVLFDSYDKFMSILMSFLSILSYWVFTWSRKAWTISKFWWLLGETKLCIYNPSIFLFRDNDSSWCMSKWSVSLLSEARGWSETLDHFASGEAKIPYQYLKKNSTFGRPLLYLSSSTEDVASTTTTHIPGTVGIRLGFTNLTSSHAVTWSVLK